MTSTNKSSERYGDELGCVVRGDGYPRFQLLTAALDDLEEITARDWLDELLAVGVVSRGLLLQCLACTYTQFATTTDTRGAGLCRRCGERLVLSRKAWKKPDDEPHWYYDLHPIMRRIISDNADVPLLAEAELAGKHRGLQGVAEFDLTASGESKLEIDLLSASRGIVIVGEAKKNSQIETRELRKKVMGLIRAAKIFTADQIVLACGEATPWNDEQIATATSLIDGASWRMGKRPELVSLSGLRV